MSRMGSSKLWANITLLFAVCGWGLSAQAKYASGSGTEAEPYRISAVSDWQELMATPADWAGHFVLTGDIDLNDVPVVPIGNSSNQFTGVFDGNDYVIRNADVNMPGSNRVGLFGCLGANGQIKNLGAEDTSILGDLYVGGLVGLNQYHVTLSNCYSTGTVSGTSNYVGGISNHVGGLVGYNHGTISNCYSTATVTGSWAVGGLVASNSTRGTVTNCYSTGSVTGGSSVGGLVGVNWETISNCYSTGYVAGTGDYVGGLVASNVGTISNCYSSSSVTGDECVGGLVGRNSGTVTNSYSTASVGGNQAVGALVGENGFFSCDIEGCRMCSGFIYECYSMGKVSGGSGIGGLVGVHVDGEVGDSFWDIETSEQSTSAGGESKTTAEMKTQSTFISAGWDFTEVWDIGENQTYPFLRTYAAGDINHDGVVDFRDVTHLAESWLSGV